MSTEDHPDWFTLTAYFAGEGTAEERRAMEQWLSAVPERWQRVEQLRVLWDARNHRPPREYDRETAVAHVMTAIHGMDHARARRTLPQMVRAAFDGVASRAMAALFGPRDATLSATEVDRVRALIEQAEREDP